jgi:hypothetical protein
MIDFNLDLREDRRKRRRQGKRPSIATLRVCELNRLFYTRYSHHLPDDDAGREDVAIMVNHLVMLADTLAKALNLTDAERTRLKIRTIGAVDCTKAEREARRRECKRLAKEAKRRTAGVKPRPQSASHGLTLVSAARPDPNGPSISLASVGPLESRRYRWPQPQTRESGRWCPQGVSLLGAFAVAPRAGGGHLDRR